MSDRPGLVYLQPAVRSDGPIFLADPDPAWVGEFAREERRIRAALGKRAILIEHVGSTSVPELIAKPVIDIVLVVADSAAEATYLPDLEAAGYELQLREPEFHEHRLLRDHDPYVHVHVFTVGSPELERMLLSRDRLRAIPQERDLYQRTKRELADRQWEYAQDYADAKSSVVAEIISRLRQISPALCLGEGVVQWRTEPGRSTQLAVKMMRRFVRCSSTVRLRSQHLPLGYVTWSMTCCPQPSRSCGTPKDRSAGVSGRRSSASNLPTSCRTPAMSRLASITAAIFRTRKGVLPDTGGKQAGGTLSMRSMKITTAEQITRPELRALIEAAAADQAARLRS